MQPGQWAIGSLVRSPLLLVLTLCLLGWPLDASADRVGRLIQILREDPSYKVRLRVVITLSKLEDPRIPPALVRALADKSHLVRALSARALSDVGDATALPLIRRLARRDRHHYVRQMASRSARRLAKRLAQAKGRLFVRVGKIHNRSRTGGRKAVELFRGALLEEFRRTPGVVTEIDGGRPSAAALRRRGLRGFALNGTIQRLGQRRSGPDLVIQCAVRVELSTYPEGSMKAFYAGESRMEVAARHPGWAQLVAYYRELFEGAAREARAQIMRSYLASQ